MTEYRFTMFKRFVVSGVAAAAAIALGGCNKGEEAAAPAPGGETASAALPAAVPAPTGQDWLETVSATELGGVRLGNPDAKVKLIEYASFTCPHCAEFAAEAYPVLKRDYISKGLVSLEFRNFVRDRADLAATLVARCGGSQPFFKMAEGIFADQKTWFDKAVNISAADQAAMQGAAPAQAVAMTARATGLDQFARLRGIGQAKLDACFGDKAIMDQIETGMKRAQELGVSGTPSFEINGQLLEGAFNWTMLEPRVREALGS
jgi:protein-disulfide isomerase